MNPADMDALTTLRGFVTEQQVRARELRERSNLLIEQAKQLGLKVETLHKRAEAIRAASKLACGNNNYVLKKCACGKEHTVPAWFELPFAGYQEHKIMSGEMRNCTCASTLFFVTRRETT